ncbi:MAG: 50S ribosomal protein L25, partial [Actinobacteria bacterium]|nr:50S ribosomal protein L25 [Actinomycetota bacterium]
MELKLEARKRELTGKGGARKIRAQGEVPAVVYGLGTESRNLAVKKGDIWEAIQGEAGLNVLIDLQVVDGKEKDSHLVMIKEVQRHPFKEMILHVDFLMVARDETVTMKVPIKIVGEQESVGLKNGGTLQHSLWDVEV